MCTLSHLLWLTYDKILFVRKIIKSADILSDTLGELMHIAIYCNILMSTADTMAGMHQVCKHSSMEENIMFIIYRSNSGKRSGATIFYTEIAWN